MGGFFFGVGMMPFVDFIYLFLRGSKQVKKNIVIVVQGMLEGDEGTSKEKQH